MRLGRGQLTILGVIAASVALGAALWLWRGNVASQPKIYCGPDGKLTAEAPKQSHRSYCVRAYLSGTSMTPGTPTNFSFDIVDDRGQIVREFATVHEKQMHVIVVRKDLAQFQHVHPTFSPADGRFTVHDLTFSSAGQYRVFADFTPRSAMLGPDGEPLPVTIGVDLPVGDQASYQPEPLPTPSETIRVGDYEVALSRPDTLRAGEEVRLVFTVRQGGVAASDLEPYLGANGHAVTLREGDLTFLHSHAVEDRSALQTGQLPFMVHFAEAGRYRIFVQFQHKGAVQTAAFTLPAVIGEQSVSSGGHSGH